MMDNSNSAGACYFIGWDVGSWMCKGESQDAFAVLKDGESEDKSNFEPVVVRGKFSDRILNREYDELHKLFNSIFKQKNTSKPEGKFKPEDKFVIAIDAVLKWPNSFKDLLNGNNPHSEIDGNAVGDIATAITRRCTECKIRDADSKAPLSAISHAIGSHSTKAIYFLNKYFPSPSNKNKIKPYNQDSFPYAWHHESNVALETYPGPIRRKKDEFKELMSTFKKLLS